MRGHHDLGILLGLGYQAFVQELTAWMASQGFDDLGRNYGYVFRALDEEVLQLNQLAQRLGITNQGTMKIVDEMERLGYVERHSHPKDGRAKELRLGQRGKAALKAARRFHVDYEKHLRKKLGAAQVDTLRLVLEEVVASDSPADRGRLRAM